MASRSLAIRGALEMGDPLVVRNTLSLFLHLRIEKLLLPEHVGRGTISGQWGLTGDKCHWQHFRAFRLYEGSKNYAPFFISIQVIGEVGIGQEERGRGQQS